MNENELARKRMECKQEEVRTRRRQKLRGMNGIDEDLNKLGIKGCQGYGVVEEDPEGIRSSNRAVVLKKEKKIMMMMEVSSGWSHQKMANEWGFLTGVEQKLRYEKLRYEKLTVLNNASELEMMRRNSEITLTY